MNVKAISYTYAPQNLCPPSPALPDYIQPPQSRTALVTRGRPARAPPSTTSKALTDQPCQRGKQRKPKRPIQIGLHKCASAATAGEDCTQPNACRTHQDRATLQSCSFGRWNDCLTQIVHVVATKAGGKRVRTVEILVHVLGVACRANFVH